MEEQRVTISDVDIPFGRMVAIILKWMIASIPAMIIMWFLSFFVMLVFGAGLGSIAALFSR